MFKQVAVCSDVRKNISKLLGICLNNSQWQHGIQQKEKYGGLECFNLHCKKPLSYHHVFVLNNVYISNEDRYHGVLQVKKVSFCFN